MEPVWLARRKELKRIDGGFLLRRMVTFRSAAYVI
jgi:hypothetical protein